MKEEQQGIFLLQSRKGNLSVTVSWISQKFSFQMPMEFTTKLLSLYIKQHLMKTLETEAVFNCKDLVWVTGIQSYRDQPTTLVSHFRLYWNHNLKLSISYAHNSDQIPKPLIEARDCFINHIGHSFLTLDAKYLTISEIL